MKNPKDIRIIKSEFKSLKDLLNASKTTSATVIGYHYGEVRVYRNIAYISIGLGRGYWYILYTKDISPIKEDTEYLEFTDNGEIRCITSEEFGLNAKSTYYIVLHPLKDDIADELLSMINQK
ncbi:MAG: hypothetical protein QXH96_00650 [Candidatus Geothermarchaeota archaeon]